MTVFFTTNMGREQENTVSLVVLEHSDILKENCTVFELVRGSVVEMRQGVREWQISNEEPWCTWSLLPQMNVEVCYECVDVSLGEQAI